MASASRLGAGQVGHWGVAAGRYRPRPPCVIGRSNACQLLPDGTVRFDLTPASIEEFPQPSRRGYHVLGAGQPWLATTRRLARGLADR
jgi:hypothetical protein